MMVKIVLAAGVLLYFAVRWFLWHRYKSAVLQRINPLYLVIDFCIAGATAFQLSFSQIGEISLGRYADAVQWLGFSLFLIGILFSSWARLVLGKYWGSAFAYQEALTEQELVIAGPFSMVRHPVYGGMILVGFGFELTLVNWLVLAILPLVFLLYYQAKREEKLLLRRFPGRYLAYKAKVRQMFFPKIV